MTRRNWFLTLLTPLVAKYAPKQAPPKALFTAYAYMDEEHLFYDLVFAHDDMAPKIGDTIQIKRPQRFMKG